MPIYRFYKCDEIVVSATSRKEAELIAEHILKKHVVCKNLRGVPYKTALAFIKNKSIMAWAVEGGEDV